VGQEDGVRSTLTRAACMAPAYLEPLLVTWSNGPVRNELFRLVLLCVVLVLLCPARRGSSRVHLLTTLSSLSCLLVA
jgi:hypothetical protein